MSTHCWQKEVQPRHADALVNLTQLMAQQYPAGGACVLAGGLAEGGTGEPPGPVRAEPELLPRAAGPTPATHAILTQLKAGDTVHQAGELPKTH